MGFGVFFFLSACPWACGMDLSLFSVACLCGHSTEWDVLCDAGSWRHLYSWCLVAPFTPCSETLDHSPHFHPFPNGGDSGSGLMVSHITRKPRVGWVMSCPPRLWRYFGFAEERSTRNLLPLWGWAGMSIGDTWRSWVCRFFPWYIDLQPLCTPFRHCLAWLVARAC